MSITRASIVLISSLILLGIATAAKAQTCSGSGCQYIVLTKREADGCMVFVNKSPYRVTIRTGAGGHAPTVYGNSSAVLESVFYGCMKNLLGTYTATAHDVPPKKKVAQPEEARPAENRPAPRQRPAPAPQAEEAPEQYTFRVSNRCPSTIKFHLRYKELGGEWRTLPPWKIYGYRHETLKGLMGGLIASENSVAYFYAESADSNYEWSGEGEKGSRIFKRIQVRPEDSALEVSFSRWTARGNQFQTQLTCR
ncbi:hypothetical protein B5P45_02980 [Phyllobacterium zundukense]|uniref:Uncharacterized protein n=1 Tax=Phyllobacterium zundukense TaxID=1867719 RepID=A0A2N9W4V9_9HYPH|nr:hypothetical protein BLM14_09095 [Phyllobacterium zundukense]PIO46777.1 hypothetical protein B5P45_02980 [Phyllobacterium zundukense]